MGGLDCQLIGLSLINKQKWAELLHLSTNFTHILPPWLCERLGKKKKIIDEIKFQRMESTL